jgi:hypothetical protein
MKSWQAKLVLATLLILFPAGVSSCPAKAPVPPGGREESGAVDNAAEEQEKEQVVARAPAAVVSPRAVVPGDFVLLAAGPSPAGTLVRLETELPVAVSPPYRHGEYTYFILGLGFTSPPGNHRLALFLEESGGALREIYGALEVLAPDFDAISFTVPAWRTSGWDDQQLADDRELVRRSRLQTGPYPLWHQPFIIPVPGEVSSGFGQIRIINQGPPGHHTGIDIPAVTGTPVKAMNDGVVRLAARLLAYGNIVILDHGMDLSSSYLHMDALAVETGQSVSRGQVIGCVGETGFVTGPHLHWEVNLGVLPINPMQLIKGDIYILPVPATAR